MKAVCHPTVSSLEMQLTGYYDLRHCAAPDVVFKYPLGVCTQAYSSNGLLWVGALYSVRPTKKSLNLEYSSFAYGDCGGVGSQKELMISSKRSCSSNVGTVASLSNATLPALQVGYRYIEFFFDSGCNGTAPLVMMAKDGCVPIRGPIFTTFFAKMECNANGTSTIQYYPEGDTSCSSQSIIGPFIVSPQICFSTFTYFMKTWCAY